MNSISDSSDTDLLPCNHCQKLDLSKTAVDNEDPHVRTLCCVKPSTGPDKVSIGAAYSA